MHYPPQFTFHQLKTFINAGSVAIREVQVCDVHPHNFDSDLGLLKRDKKLQERYNTWSAGIRQEYGSIGEFCHQDAITSKHTSDAYAVKYLLTYRLQWGKRDARSLLKSTLDIPYTLLSDKDVVNGPSGELPPLPPNAPPFFKADTPPDLISIIMNDWPYSGRSPSTHPSSPPLTGRSQSRAKLSTA